MEAANVKKLKCLKTYAEVNRESNVIKEHFAKMLVTADKRSCVSTLSKAVLSIVKQHKLASRSMGRIKFKNYPFNHKRIY